uniref:Protein amnionless n=1 Tax=Trichuris muris TaxID=70415 RepID=A0A5S6QX92_TRIMR
MLLLPLSLLLVPFGGFGAVFEFRGSQRAFNDRHDAFRCVPVKMGSAFAMVGEMYLPNLQMVGDWELIFANDSTLWLGADECPKSTVGPSAWDYWWDPSLWNLVDGAQPLLYADMVPGEFDVAIFPPQFAYRVNVSLSPSVGRLFFGAREQTNETFYRYMRTSEGSLQFTGASVNVVQSECTFRSSCPNGNSDSAKMNEICKHVRCSSDPPCANSFTPVGHCCPLCGATFKFPCHEENANVLGMQRDAIVARHTCQHGDLPYAISKLYNSTYCQIVVAGQKADGNFDGPAALDCLSTIKERYELKDTIDLIVSSEPAAVNYVLLLCLSTFFLLTSLILWQYASLKGCMLNQIIRLRVLWSREQDDRLHLEMTEPSDRKFENPTYSQLLQREDMLGEELIMAAAEFYRTNGKNAAEKF